MNKQISITNISQVGTVFVPVSDQDQALDFYISKLGFEKRVDALYAGGKRWIEIAPPQSGINIALVPIEEGRPSFDDRTHCAFLTKDIQADFEILRKRGVDIVDEQIGKIGTSRLGLISTEVIIKDPMPLQFSFRDPDGNRFLLVQP